MNTIRGIFGCEPNKVSTNILAINAGVVWDFYGYAAYEFPSLVSLDFTIVGLGGYDISGGPIDGSNLCIYLIANDSTGEYGFIGTSSIYEGGVVLPSGFSVKRKLPWGVIYNSSRDGIPSFHLTHWPMPMITLTNAESTSAYNALGAGNSTVWADVDLSSWVPDNARLVHLLIETRYISSVCSAYLRTYGGQSTGMRVASVSANSVYNIMEKTIRVTSDRKIQYKLNAAGAQLFIYVMGYSMTEPA